ncbi:hypothetical protein ACS0TY_018002 [Phlomoides rotata]
MTAENDRSRQHRADRGKGTWQPPPVGMLKINSDGATSAHGRACLGFVIRDDRGIVRLLGAQTRRIDGDSTLLEALAMKFGLKIAAEHGLQNLIMEADSSNLIQAIRGELVVDPYSMSIVKDIRTMTEGIGYSDYLYTKRESNCVAHTIARTFVGWDFEKIWVRGVPENCISILVKDVRREPTIS